MAGIFFFFFFKNEHDVIPALGAFTDSQEVKGAEVLSCKPKKLQVQAPWVLCLVPTQPSRDCGSSVCPGCSKENFFQVGGEAQPTESMACLH